MKVLSRNSNRFIVDPEDGHPQMLVVAVENFGRSLTLFPRFLHLEAIASKGGWVAPSDKQRRLVLALLEGAEIPEPEPLPDETES